MASRPALRWTSEHLQPPSSGRTSSMEMHMYVDGFVLPVAKKHLAAYKRMANLFGRICLEHGVLQYFECALDRAPIKVGLSFEKLVKPRPGETVIFSWVVFKSKSHRDKVHAAMMKDARMQKPPKEMPFDMKRMTWGGFKPIVKMK